MMSSFVYAKPKIRQVHGQVDSELWLFYMQGNSSTNELTMTNNMSLNRNNLKCYAFNYVGSCYKQGCSYSHTCIHCGAGHSVKVCYIKQGHSRNGFNATVAKQSNRNYTPFWIFRCEITS